MMSDDDDNISVGSSASISNSISSYRSETGRHREKIRSLRIKRRAKKSGIENPRPHSPGSIMTVRTLEESLSGEESKITSLRKRRRNAKLQVNCLKKSMSDLGSSSVGGGNQSNDDSLRSTNSLDLSVGFDQIQIREYRVVCGDNPSVSTGPPVQLDWASVDLYSCAIEDFEHQREGNRRIQSQMRIPEYVRKKTLVTFGNSKEDIEDCTKQATITRKQRISTMASLETSIPHIEENFERVTRALLKPFRRKEKQAERQLWEKLATATV